MRNFIMVFGIPFAIVGVVLAFVGAILLYPFIWGVGKSRVLNVKWKT